MMGILEIYFFFNYQITTGYSINQIIIGVFASLCNIIATSLMIYAATYGLAGPSSAMVQSQGVIHVLLSAVFLNAYPNAMDYMGLSCAIIGATVMSIEIPEGSIFNVGCGNKYSDE